MNTEKVKTINQNKYLVRSQPRRIRRSRRVPPKTAIKQNLRLRAGTPTAEQLETFGGALVVDVFDTYTIRFENDRKFDEFMNDRDYELLESKMPVSMKAIYGQIFGMNFNFNKPLFPTKKYSDPINEAIHQYYKQKLRNIPNLNLMKEINVFLKLYFFKPQKIKERTPKKENTKQFIEMADRNLNPSQITNKLAEVEFERLMNEFLEAGFSEERAKFMADENLKGWKGESEKRIRAALSYHRSAKRDMKTAEKLMPNFFCNRKKKN